MTYTVLSSPKIFQTRYLHHVSIGLFRDEITPSSIKADSSPDVDFTWESKLRQASGNDELSRYEQFLRERLPDAVRSELETAIEHEYPFESRVVSQLVQIVRDQQLRLFQLYTHSRASEVHITEPEAHTIGQGVRTIEACSPVGNLLTPTTHHNQHRRLRTNGPNMLWDVEELASHDPAPYPSELLDLGLDAVQFEIYDCEILAQDFRDSTYGSVSVEGQEMTDLCGSDMWVNSSGS